MMFVRNSMRWALSMCARGRGEGGSFYLNRREGQSKAARFHPSASTDDFLRVVFRFSLV